MRQVALFLFFSADMIQGYIISKRLETRGFIISDPHFKPRYPEAVKQLAEWISSVSNCNVNRLVFCFAFEKFVIGC